MRLWIVLAITLTATMATIADSSKLRFQPGARSMRNELRRLIQVGTEITLAETTMKSNGFSCKRRTNDDFLATDDGTTDSKFIQRKNFLLCEHTEPGPSSVSRSRRWKVALINEDDKVVNILVGYGLVDP